MFTVAMASYLKEDYDEILKISEDSDKLDADWDSWKLKSAQRIRQMEQMGMKVERITIRPVELLRYCKDKEIAVIGSSRAQMATEIMKSNA